MFILILLFKISMLLNSPTTTTTYYEIKYPNGHVYECGTMTSEGIRHGEIIRYHPNGKTEVKAKFDKGTRIGTWIHHNLSGSVVMKVKYDNDKPVEVIYVITKR